MAKRNDGPDRDRAPAAEVYRGEADEVQDVSHRDPGSNISEVNARHGGGSQGRVPRRQDWR